MTPQDFPAHIRRSPARMAQHAKQLRAAAVAASGPHGEIVGSAYELLRAQLAQHQIALRAVQSIERKVEMKGQYLTLDSYVDWIKTTLASGTGAQDDLFVTLMVWSIDCYKMGQAAVMADYVLTHGLTMPDRFERSAPAVLAEEFALVYLSGKWPASEPPAYTTLDLIRAKTDGMDMHDQIRAKLYKAMGYAVLGLLSTNDTEAFTAIPLDLLQLALPMLVRAIELFDGVGVKKDIERIERAIRNKTRDMATVTPAATS